MSVEILYYISVIHAVQPTYGVKLRSRGCDSSYKVREDMKCHLAPYQYAPRASNESYYQMNDGCPQHRKRDEKLREDRQNFGYID